MSPNPTSTVPRDAAESLWPLLLDCYVMAIRNLAHYAVEVDEELTGPYRKYLSALADEVESGAPEMLSRSRSSLRALLRDYRDKASACFNQLKQELTETASALQRLLDVMSESEGDYEQRLQQALARLRELCRGDAGQALLPALRDTTQAIEQSLEDLSRQQKLTVSQFVIEIGLLHKRIDALEAAVSVDALTKLFTRGEMEHRIRSVADGGAALPIRVLGLRRAGEQFSAEVGRQLAEAFIKRLRNSLVPGALIGRWSPEEFLVLLAVSGKEARAGAEWIQAHLAGTYACLHRGKTVRLRLEVETAVVEFTAGADPEGTLRQIGEFLKE